MPATLHQTRSPSPFALLCLWDTNPNPSLPTSSFRPKSPSINCASCSQYNAASPFGFLHKLHWWACFLPLRPAGRETLPRQGYSGTASPVRSVTPAQPPTARPGPVTPTQLPAARPGAVPGLRSPRRAAGAGRRRRGPAAGAEVRRVRGRGGGAVLASGVVLAASLLCGERSEAILQLPLRRLPERFRPDPHGASRA